ncbi:ABC transporter permease [Psychromicrobium lacuslunae]|uniref:Phosphonate ABC transporter permease n=1 Tax=Psychromicrobium lacuslunae TaxID=1618207 RepID=A0A0D4C052_9MICC|nr:ABC transporter permease subunit [Psychromicrobium lacuslunae]AJT41731.1 phosphonate ABC transporter permease [Psychromicrobium lacuslunae]
MLRFSTPAKLLLWLIAALLVLFLVIAPLAVTLLASFADSWNSVLPTGFTMDHLGDSLAGENLSSISVSLQTAVLSSLLAVALGSWAAIATQSAPTRLAKVLNLAFHLPVAVPSVVVGLALLVAFSRGAILLNGTVAMVVLAQTLLVLSFAFSSVSSALAGLDPMLSSVASSLGAGSARILFRIKLPLLTPAIAAAAGLALVLCLGELGATIMVYPPSWRTLPVSIFAFADRGNIFMAAANTLLLVVTALVVLTALGRIRGRTAVR